MHTDEGPTLAVIFLLLGLSLFCAYQWARAETALELAAKREQYYRDQWSEALGRNTKLERKLWELQHPEALVK